MPDATHILSNRVADARAAMAALIEARELSLRSDDPEYARCIAELAWRIADAMAAERGKRTGRSTMPPPPSGKKGGR